MITSDKDEMADLPSGIYGIYPNKQSIAKTKLLPAFSPLENDVLNCLMNARGLNTKTVSIRLDIHQSSASHVIRDLIEEKLVTKTAQGYSLTNLGLIQMNQINHLNKTLEFIIKNKKFFSTHDMNSIPANYLMCIGMLWDHEEHFDANDSTPYLKQEYLVEHISNCKEVRYIPEIITTNHAKAMANAIKNGAIAELILSNKLQQALRKNYIPILKEILGYDNLKIYRIKEANLNLCVTESKFFLGAHRLDGSYDLENILIFKNEKSLAWGNLLFSYYRSKAELVGDNASYFFG